MRVAVIGATGNAGSAVVDALDADGDVDEVIAIARRPPDREDRAGVRWVARDVRDPELAADLRGVGAVVHLAWLIQPSRRPTVTWDVNVRGTANLLRATIEADVRAVVYASSVGAYSPRPPDRYVDESWPTHGVATSTYSREKAYVERLLDGFAADHPDRRVARMRPSFIFQRRAASGIRRLFLGTLFPSRIVRGASVPIAGILAGMRFQAVHTADVADAYRRAVLDDGADGAFNLAAAPVIDRRRLGEVLGAPIVPVPYAIARPLANLTWSLRLHPVEPGWVDLARNVPLLRTDRARTVLGWRPRRDGTTTLRELLDAVGHGEGEATPALRSDSAESRVDELMRTRQGGRQH